jgi:hypothetical protein
MSEVLHNPSDDMSEEHQKAFKKISRWFRASADNDKEFRRRARVWHDYYHGDQLSAEILLQMEARSQPPLKFNLIKSIVNLVTGQEIQGRSDIKFVGHEDSDTLPSQLLTDIYRQANADTYFPYEITMAFQDGVIGGRGAIWADWNDEDSIEREYLDWQEVFWDAASKRVDYEDARHVFHAKWVDLDVAIEMFPDKEKELQKIATGQSEYEDQYEDHNEPKGRDSGQYYDELNDDPTKWYDPQRERVRLVEAWYYQLNDKTKKNEIYNCVFAEDIFINEPKLFGRKHGKFPIIPTYFMRDRHHKPYGLVKDLVDPQDVINRSFSKSMHILGTRQILAEKGALPNVQKVQEEICKPDAIINDFEDGSLQNNRVRIEENRADAAMAFQHFEIGVNAMSRVSGVNPEMQGLSSNVRSGTAISMRLRQGNTVLTSIYDSLEKTKKRIAEIYVYLMAQYMKTEEVMRYKSPNGEIQETTVNGVTQETVGSAILNVESNKLQDIFKYDIVITETAASANANEATLNSLVELIKVAPSLQNNPQFLAEIIKSTNLPNKEEMAQSFLPPSQPAGQDATATQ